MAFRCLSGNFSWIESIKYTHHKSLATLDGEIVDPEIIIKIEMRDILKVHDAQT